MADVVESVLIVTGDCTWVNTFDAAFRCGSGPSWADQPDDPKPCYSLHNLHPVPEDVQRRGYEKAGRLWCRRYWKCDGDLIRCAVLRGLNCRFYRMLTPGHAPTDAFSYAAYRFAPAQFQLVLIDPDKNQLEWHRMDVKWNQTTMTPHVTNLEEALNHSGVPLPEWG